MLPFSQIADKNIQKNMALVDKKFMHVIIYMSIFCEKEKIYVLSWQICALSVKYD